ncbi:hypothetical protein ACF0H5_013033 [Mactra antiquata]
MSKSKSYNGCVLFVRFLKLSSLNNIRNSTTLSMSTLLQPYRPPEWAKELQNIPSSKIQLANGNTPIYRWNLNGLPSEFAVSIKRDDMTGSTLSGNKVRKLEFLMAKAISSDCKHVITCGGIQSNHCRAVAVCSRQLGLQPHLVLRTDISNVDEVGCKGNLLLDRLCGAKIYLTARKSPYLTELKPRMEALAKHILETTGEQSYLIPVGGSDTVGLFGYISVFEELLSQGLHEQFDDIVFACGSGGTAGGLAIANYLTGNKLRIHGIAVSDDANYFHHHCNEMIKSVGLNVKSQDILDIIDGHKGQGYGISTQDELDFIINVSTSTGILLDPVYTGKAVKGMVYELNNNPDMFKGNRILYLHTGGIYGLYDGTIDNTVLRSSSSTNYVKLWTNKTDLPT